VPKKEIDELYLNSPYYIVPDGEVGQQAFAVIREAIRKEGMVALARVVFTSREHVIALEPRGKGLLGMTLRYPYEVRKEDEYFDDIEDEKIPKDMMELASHIVETKSGHFKPGEFEDHYEDALKELLKKKQSGEKIEAPRAREPAKVISLMDALRRSVDTERGGGARGQSERRPAQRRAPKKAGRYLRGRRRPANSQCRPFSTSSRSARRRALIRCLRKLGTTFPTCWTSRVGREPPSIACARRYEPRRPTLM
jgi:DNA end-binding protein Ku